jgi:hypothetical protein
VGSAADPTPAFDRSRNWATSSRARLLSQPNASSAISSRRGYDPASTGSGAARPSSTINGCSAYSGDMRLP